MGEHELKKTTKPQKPPFLYRWWKANDDYEGITWYVDPGGDLIISWIAVGSGMIRKPVATKHGNRAVVTWQDVEPFSFWVPPAVINCGGDLKVVLAKG